MGKAMTLEKQCDNLWSAIIKLRAKGNCQMKGCNRKGIWAHHIARRGGAVRWFVANGIYLCLECHDHSFEPAMNARIMEVIGFDKFGELVRMSHEIKQWKSSDLAVLREDLQQVHLKEVEIIR